MGDAATPVLPDFTSQLAATYKANIDAGFAVADRLAWAFAPHEQGVPDMTVRLEAGAIFDGATLSEVAAQSTGIITAPTINPRIDRVVIDRASGAVSVVTGTEDPSPVAPAIIAGKVPIAQVALIVSQTEIVNADLTDERDLRRLGQTGAQSKNLVKNGAMAIAQRGTSFTGVGAATTEYTLDRFLVYGKGAPQARATVTQESGVFGGFGYSAKIDCTTAEAAVAATELWSWQQRIEAQDLQHLRYGNAAAKTLTLTFEIKSPKSGTHCVALYQPDGARSFVREFTVAAANTAEEITVTFPGDASGTINNDSGEGLRITWPLVAGANFQVAADAWAAGEDYATSNQQNLLDNVANDFEITGIQLELGSNATVFDRRSFGQNLALCQRYYQKTFPLGTAPAQNAGQTGAISYRTDIAAANADSVYIQFKVTMRIAPTFVFYNPSAANGLWRNQSRAADSGTPSPSNTADHGAELVNPQVAADATAQLCNVHYTIDSEL